MKQILKKIFKIIPLFIILTIGLVFSPKAHAAAASFAVNGGGDYQPGSTIVVTLYAASQGNMNAVEATVTFSNLTYVSHSPSISTIANTVNGNTIYVAGALLGSSAQGTLEVMTMTFTAPSSAGSASISVSGNVSYNDGQGTTVPASGTANFNIVSPPTATPELTEIPATDAPPAPTDVPQNNNPTATTAQNSGSVPSAVVVSSSTHPNPLQWYNSTAVTVSWSGGGNGITDYSYDLNNTSNYTPDDASEGSSTSATYSGLTEGTYYFHIKAGSASGWGNVSTFRINIDTSAPSSFTVRKIDPLDGSGYILDFTGNDTNSGIESYRLTLDGQDKGTISSGYKIPTSASSIRVFAIDRAGNQTEGTVSNAVITATGGKTSPTTSLVATTSSTPVTTSGSSSGSNLMLYVAIGIMAVALIGGGAYFFMKNKNGKGSDSPPVSASDASWMTPSSPLAPSPITNSSNASPLQTQPLPVAPQPNAPLARFPVANTTPSSTLPAKSPALPLENSSPLQGNLNQATPGTPASPGL